MGLLNRIENKTVSGLTPTEVTRPSLDDMGKALKERLRRLPEKKSTPYTALSLLKAYGAFQAGFCLSLNNGVYSSYTSVGLGIEKISIGEELIRSGEKKGEKYFKLNSAKSLDINEAGKDLMYWVFPLDSGAAGKGEPWKAVMLLGVLDSSFDPNPVSLILEDVADKLVLPADSPAAGEQPDKTEADPGSTKPVPADFENEVILFHRMYLDFNCIVLENPAVSDGLVVSEEEKTDFCRTVLKMIHNAGTVIPLPSGNPLILLPIVVDRELIIHRLSKTLNTKPLLSFEANNPENVFTRLDSLV